MSIAIVILAMLVVLTLHSYYVNELRGIDLFWVPIASQGIGLFCGALVYFGGKLCGIW